MTSLRTRLFGVWALSLAASVAVGVLLIQLYRLSTESLVQRAESELSQACERMSDRYLYYVSGWTGPLPQSGDAAFQRDLDGVANLALAASPSLAGGILRDPSDIDPPTTPSSTAAAALAASRGSSLDISSSGTTTTLVSACRLSGPVPDMAAWVATEVEAAPGYSELRIGVGVLLALMLSLSAALTLLVTSWSRQVRRMEEALARHDTSGLPPIAPTGEVELDRIAAALNSARARLLVAQNEAKAASSRAALAERMAALGRVAAGVAHEIRNPIAAMRLRAEGALAVDPALEPERSSARGRAALGAIIGQIDRLDRLSGELLTMTQRRVPVPDNHDLRTFLESCRQNWPDAELVIAAAPGTGRFDADMIRRALDNLIQNALRHAPAASIVTLRAGCGPDLLRFEVEDNGPGVPEALRDNLFEPFVTSRADGTGLGLSIAREMAQAHDGRLFLAHPGPGPVFALELPQDPHA
jgi:signal transduction histidine kinase